MNTISYSWPSAAASSHLRVPSFDTCAVTTVGRPMMKRSVSQGRIDFAISVIAPNSVTPR